MPIRAGKQRMCFEEVGRTESSTEPELSRDTQIDAEGTMTSDVIVSAGKLHFLAKQENYAGGATDILDNQ